MEQKQLDPVQNVAALGCEFLKKADLKGVEVPAYSEVWNFLNALFAGELSVIPTKVLHELQESDDEIALMQECIKRWPKSVGTRVDQVRAEKPVPPTILPGAAAVEPQPAKV